MKKILFILVSFLVIGLSAVGQTVYVTKTGDKYHTSSCSYLRQSKIAKSLAEAQRSGYTACSKCKPDAGQSVRSKQSSQSIRSGASASVQCVAITQKGTRCSRMTKDPSGKCWQH